MVYDYIIQNYKNGEPIFLSELPGDSKDYLRQEMKRLCDDGRLERLYIEKKYLNAGGYVTGLQLANRYGFTTQNPSCYEVCSNEATTKQRKQMVDGNTIIVYKPATDITENNKSALQFLDLMSSIDRYSEIAGAELVAKLKKYVKAAKVDFSVVKELLPLYPDKVYRNIYEGGLMGELV